LLAGADFHAKPEQSAAGTVQACEQPFDEPEI
jgi:hypothetical protein